MIRPLYLDAATRWSVGLDDGPALKVSAPGRARSLYPLSRVARVLSPAHADWTTPALLACLQAGVPIVFHDARGEPLGWCFGPRRRETSLGNLLRLAVDHPEGGVLLQQWQRACERREILEALAEALALTYRPDAASARARLCNVHRVRLGQPAGSYVRALQRSATAMVSEHLYKALGDPSLIGFSIEGVHLGEVLASLMEWQLHRVLLRVRPQSLMNVCVARFAAAEMERSGAELHSACGRLLGDLERFLRERLL